MDPTVLELLQRQLRDGFPDLAGSEVVAKIPISDRVLNELIAGLLSYGGKVRDVRLRAEEGNRLTAEIQLAGPRFLPTLAVRIAIEDQPGAARTSDARAQTGGPVRSGRESRVGCFRLSLCCRPASPSTVTASR